MADFATIENWIETGVRLLKLGVEEYNAIQATLSETDRDKIKANLAAAQAIQIQDRAEVDAELDAASQR